MERRRPKRIPPNSRRGRLIKKKKHTQRLLILFTIITLLLISITSVTIKKIYISKKCSSLHFAVDYYFTNWQDKKLRLLHVQSMTLVNKNKDIAMVEVYGLTYEEPRHRTTLVGTFKKDKEGTWFMNSVKPSVSVN